MTINEIYNLYTECFPFIYRERKTVLDILKKEDNEFVEERNNENKLIGVSVINKNTILMLCVLKKYRNRGIGTKLLKESEKIIENNGYDKIILGLGFNYLMPGIPTSKHYYKTEHENLYKDINDNAETFFKKNNYEKTSDCDYFDMGFYLDEYNFDYNIGDTINGISYRFASIEDLYEICKCTDDAEDSFTKYYKNKDLYSDDSKTKVIVAVKDNEIVGTIMADLEKEGKKVGSIGCTTTKHKYRDNHIAVNLTSLATKYLKEHGMNYAHLSYTYTGLDHVYGYAGYEICVYYTMAEKN